MFPVFPVMFIDRTKVDQSVSFKYIFVVNMIFKIMWLEDHKLGNFHVKMFSGKDFNGVNFFLMLIVYGIFYLVGSYNEDLWTLFVLACKWTDGDSDPLV